MSPNKSAIRLLILGWFLLFSDGVFAYTLSGTVYGDSNPLANVSVKAVLSSDQNLTVETVTDSSGKYTLTLNNGVYRLVITPPSGSGFSSASMDGVEVLNADVQQDILLIKDVANYTYSGVVRGFGGAPMAGVLVGTSLSNGDHFQEAPTNSDGSFSISLPAGENYQFQVRGWISNMVKGAPGHFIYSHLLTMPAANITQDIQIPFVELKGKTIDNNGAAVGNVTLNTVYSSIARQADGAWAAIHPS